MQLTIPPELESQIQSEIDRGHYRTPVEVIAQALSSLRAEDEAIALARANLDAKLEESFAAVARGEWISAEDFEAEMDAWRAKIS